MNESESEIDKIYKKHKKLDELIDFDQLYINELRRAAKEPEYISRLLAEAKENESQGKELPACAQYLAAVSCIVQTSSRRDNSQFNKILDSLRAAVRIALKNDSRLQNKFMNNVRSSSSWISGSDKEGLEFQDHFCSEVLRVAEALGDKKKILEITSQLARVKQSKKDFEAAITLYKKCIELAPRVENSSALLNTYQAGLQSIYKEQGNESASSALIKERIAAAESSNPSSSMSTEKLIQLQNLYLEDGKLEQAAETLKLSVASLENQLSKQESNPDPHFSWSGKHQIGASAESLLGFVKKLEAKGIKAQDLHERILRAQYRCGKGERDPWFSTKVQALTSFLMKNGKPAEAAEILKAEIAASKQQMHPHRFSDLETSYLAALKAANLTDEYNKIMQERAEALRKQQADQLQQFESQFVEARNKIKSDPNLYFQIALTLVGQRLHAKNKAQAQSLIPEVLESYNLIGASKLNGAALSAMWSLLHFLPALNYNTQATDTRKIEREILEAYEQWDAKQARDKDEDHFSRDLIDVSRNFGFMPFSEKIELINFVISIRKKYSSHNKERLQEAYEWLIEAYSESGNKQKEKEAREELVQLLKGKSSTDKEAILKQEIEIAVSEITYVNREQIIKKLEGFIPEIASYKKESKYGLNRIAGDAFCTVANLFVANGDLNGAQDVLKSANLTARKNNIDLPIYEQKKIFDKIVSNLLARLDFSGAESCLELKIAQMQQANVSTKAKASEQDLIDLGDSMVRLSEIFLLQSRTLAGSSGSSGVNGSSLDGSSKVDGSSSVDGSPEAKRLIAKSDKQLEEAISVYKNCKSGFALWSIGWAKRRHAYSAKSGKNPDDFHKYAPLNIKLRHHLEDVPNQRPGRPPQPFTCAVLARSYVDIGAACSTAAIDTSKNTGGNSGKPAHFPTYSPKGTMETSSASAISASGGTAEDSNEDNKMSGAEVYSNGTTILNGSARVPATVGGRNIVMTAGGGGGIQVLGGMNAGGNIPDAFPWQAPPEPTNSSKVISAVIADARVEAAPPGSIADLGEFSVAAGKSIKLAAGDYLVSRIQILEGAKIEIDTSASPSPDNPVRFFVKDINSINSKEVDAPQILLDGAQLNQSGRPVQMQFWCAGAGLVLMKGSKIRGTIYSPGGIIIASGSEIVGALAADEVRLKNASKVIFDLALPPSPKLGLPLLKVPALVDPDHVQGGSGGSITSTGARPEEDYQALRSIGTGEYNEAIKFYSDALSKYPSMQNYVGRAECYIRTQQFDNALKDCITAIEAEPDYALAHAICGQVYQKLGEKQKAKEQFDRALELCPIDEGIDDLLFLAICQNGIGNSEAALEILNEALAIMTTSTELFLFRADLYDQTGRSELASKDRTTVEELRKKVREQRQKEKEVLEEYKQRQQQGF